MEGEERADALHTELGTGGLCETQQLQLLQANGKVHSVSVEPLHTREELNCLGKRGRRRGGQGGEGRGRKRSVVKVLLYPSGGLTASNCKVRSRTVKKRWGL